MRFKVFGVHIVYSGEMAHVSQIDYCFDGVSIQREAIDMRKFLQIAQSLVCLLSYVFRRHYFIRVQIHANLPRRVAPRRSTFLNNLACYIRTQWLSNRSHRCHS